MSWKVLGNPVYRKWSEWAVGDVFEGVFNGTQKDQYKKENLLFTVVSVSFADKSEEARFPSGQNAALNSGGDLTIAYNKGEFEDGDTVRVTYLGLKEMTGGPYAGKSKHTMKIEVKVKDEVSAPQAQVNDGLDLL